jgi:glycosyltransferase involved in cell wall biosynthesis
MTKQSVETRIYTPSLNHDLFGGICRTIDVQEIRLPAVPIFDLYYDLLVAKRLISEASKWADLLILHSCQAIASHAMRRFLRPCIPFYHIDKWDWNLFGSLRWIAPFYTRPLNALERRNLREIPLVFANSPSLAKLIRRQEPTANVVPITIGVDTSRFHPRWGRDEGFIMMAGRFHPMNNFELGLNAVADTDYKVLITGIIEEKFFSYFKHIKELVLREDSLRDKVTIVNLTDEHLVDRLQCCSLFLSPRRYDYLGHAALEPMACGKPVVQLAIGPRLDGDPPVVFCRNSPEEWRSVVQTLMKDPSTRLVLGRKAHGFVRQRHSLKASVDQVLYHAVSIVGATA